MSSKAAIRRGQAASRGAEIKQMQEDALARLPLNTFYIVLHIRNDPPAPNDFHWGYYLHTSSGGGMKYHVRNIGNRWIADHAFTGGVFKSNFLCVLVQIATVPETMHGRVDRIMRSCDENLNSVPDITCRVWVLKMAQELTKDGIVRCSNLDALEQECFTFGNQYMWDAAKAQQPRPVVKSNICA